MAQSEHASKTRCLQNLCQFYVERLCKTKTTTTKENNKKQIKPPLPPKKTSKPKTKTKLN